MGVSNDTRIERMERQLADLTAQVNALPLNAAPMQAPNGWWLGITNGGLSPLGTVSVSVYTWSITDSEWVDSEIDIEAVQDFFLNDDQDAIESGTKVRLDWYRNVWVATVIYCFPSDNVGIEEEA